MLQCYALMLCCYSYSLPIHTGSQWLYITVLHYISVPTFKASKSATEIFEMLKVAYGEFVVSRANVFFCYSQIL